MKYCKKFKSQTSENPGLFFVRSGKNSFCPMLKKLDFHKDLFLKCSETRFSGYFWGKGPFLVGFASKHGINIALKTKKSLKKTQNSSKTRFKPKKLDYKTQKIDSKTQKLDLKTQKLNFWASQCQ